MSTAAETTQVVLVDRQGGVLTMTINRAAQKNAVNHEVAGQLGATHARRSEYPSAVSVRFTSVRR